MKTIGRAKKGFLKEKNINTCTLNIINCIDGAWQDMEPTGIMCVDFSKAFDSVEHKAIESILKFFNFGANMVKMVMILLNGRKARVILEEGYSGDIPINRGTPQGDCSSPYLFIIVIEVLLIKIRTMDGQGVNCCAHIFRRIENMDIENLTAEAYADDLTLIFSMGDGVVRIICDIMEGYERCTGLGLNKGKTQLMVCGSDNWVIGTKVSEITVVESVSILGIKIDRKLERLNDNWDNATVKMRRYCGFWWNFGLSISGRVMVVKTYVLTQAIYLIGILPLPTEKGDQMNEIMTEFVRGRDRAIENRRKNLCAELGGYGIIDMNVMNISMKCSWIKRWKEEQTCADYPRAIVMGEGNVVLDRIARAEGNEGSYSLLTGIRKCWHKLKTEFYRRGGNREEILVFENDTFAEEGRGLELVIFGRGRYTVRSA